METNDKILKARERANRWYRDNTERAKLNVKKYQAANKEKCREHHKKWAVEHPEKVRISAKKSYDANKEKRTAWGREHKKKLLLLNPEQVRATARAWKRNNPDKVKISNKKWHKDYAGKYPERLAETNAKRRALQKAVNNCAGADIELLRLIYLHCPSGYHVDHITPLAKRGKHHPDNLQYLPAIINMQKGANVSFDCSEHVIRWQSEFESESFIKQLN